MAIKKITINEFLTLRSTCVVLDVRSPGEYIHAHILGALNLPLFSDEERKVVGTTYKQVSRAQAIKVGLDYYGVKMRTMVEDVEKVMEQNIGKKILVHCWRGGMRSAGVAWLLDLYGFDVYVLLGGYKSYRRWVHQLFEKEFKVSILSGNTGSGKTVVLRALKATGHNGIDLEGLANHRGSAFGGMKEPQPSQEMFENRLGENLYQINNDNTVWIEDESQRIGNLNIPHKLWSTMRKAPLYFLDVPFNERLTHILEEYGGINKEDLINATIRIQKRLGGLNTKSCIQYLQEGNVKEGFKILLEYYDKQYEKALNKRAIKKEEIAHVVCNRVNAKENAEKLIGWKNKK